MTGGTPTARALGFFSCHVCGLLSRAPTAELDHPCCPRCGSALHLRKPNSIVQAWAFVIAAAILYFPANMLPIMESSSMFGSQQDTILSGVAFLWSSGSWPLALLVFLASVLIPLGKMFSIIYLLTTVQMHSPKQPAQRARLFRLLEFIGRWSMLDIYVVALLAALVQIESLATINAGPGAIAFGAVVVLTMLATMAFDPRLIWDHSTETT